MNFFNENNIIFVALNKIGDIIQIGRASCRERV